MFTVTGQWTQYVFSATKHNHLPAHYSLQTSHVHVYVDMQRLGAGFTSVGYPPSLIIIYSANTVSSTCIIRFCSTAGNAEGT